MKKIKVLLDRETCIGSFSCVRISPKYWEMGNDGKVHLKKSLLNKDGLYEVFIDVKDFEKNKEAAENCPVKAISLKEIKKGKEVGVEIHNIFDKKVEEKTVKEVRGHYDEMKDWVMDPKGYFLIRVDKVKKELEIGFCRKGNVVEVKISGEKPQDVYFAAIQEGLISRLDHAAYLGKELEKAYLALQYNLDYVQDEDLKMQ